MVGCLGMREKSCTVFQETQDGLFINNGLLWKRIAASQGIWDTNIW